MPCRSTRSFTAALVALGLTVPLAGSSAADVCPEVDPTAVRVQVRVDLAGDGAVREVARSGVATSADGEECDLDGAADPEALPVDVAVLHRAAGVGAVEPEDLATVDGTVRTQVAVRDRTSASQELTIDGPSGRREITRAVGVPHVVRITVAYPSGWTSIIPAAGSRADVVDGGVQVSSTALLFPPLTDREVAVVTDGVPGAGSPTVTVEATPVGGDLASMLAMDDLDEVSAAVVAAFAELGADGAGELADGAGQLADGADQLAGGVDELLDGAGQLADGAGELAGGAGELAGGLGELSGGVDQLLGGFGDAADGTAELAGGAQELADGIGVLSSGADELADGLAELAGGSAQVADGNEQFADELGAAADGAAELAEGNRQLAEGLGQIAAVTGLVRTGLEDTADEIGDAIPDLGPITAPIRDALGQAFDELIAGVAELDDGAQELAAGSGALADGAEELAGGLGEARDGAGELAAGSRQVADGVGQAGDGTRELADGAGALAAGAQELAGGTGELADGLGQAAEQGSALGEGVGALAAGAQELAGGTDQLADGLGAVADEGGALGDGAGELADGVQQLADGAAELPSALGQITDTAELAGDRAAEDAAVLVRGRQLADRQVAEVGSGAAEVAFSTELVAAGIAAGSWLPWLLVAIVLVVGASVFAAPRLRRRRRAEVAA